MAPVSAPKAGAGALALGVDTVTYTKYRYKGFVSIFVILCLLICLVTYPLTANAVVAEPVMLSLGAAVVVAAIFVALGIVADQNHTTVSDMVYSCVEWLKAEGWVNARGLINCWLSDGLTYIVPNLVNAVKAWLFANNAFDVSDGELDVGSSGVYSYSSGDYIGKSDFLGYCASICPYWDIITSYSYSNYSGTFYPYNQFLSSISNLTFIGYSSYSDGSNQIINLVTYPKQYLQVFSNSMLGSGSSSDGVFQVNHDSWLFYFNSSGQLYNSYHSMSSSTPLYLSSEFSVDHCIVNVGTISSAAGYDITTDIPDAAVAVEDDSTYDDWVGLGLAISGALALPISTLSSVAETLALTQAQAQTVADVQDVAVPSLPDSPDYYAVDLKSLFPFCIPFDVYHFIQLLNATPEAPNISFDTTITAFGANIPFELELDLSEYEPAAAICRTMFLLLFIVGLASATFKFIKW